MDNKLKVLIATGLVIVATGTGALMLSSKKIIMIDKQALDLVPVFVGGYCVDGEQILFNTTPDAVDEMHCFTIEGYKRLQREVLERHRTNDHSNDGLLFAMLRKELADHKDNLSQSILLSGLIKEGSLDLLIKGIDL